MMSAWAKVNRWEADRRKYRDTNTAPQADRYDSSGGGKKNPSNCEMAANPVNIKLVSGDN